MPPVDLTGRTALVTGARRTQDDLEPVAVEIEAAGRRARQQRGDEPARRADAHGRRGAVGQGPLALYLASGASAFVTGSRFRIDGGQLLGTPGV